MGLRRHFVEDILEWGAKAMWGEVPSTHNCAFLWWELKSLHFPLSVGQLYHEVIDPAIKCVLQLSMAL